MPTYDAQKGHVNRQPAIPEILSEMSRQGAAATSQPGITIELLLNGRYGRPTTRLRLKEGGPISYAAIKQQ